ncbi:Histone-lysine N-methyltransferase Su(var)3-9, partial [Dissostichus eleginoides]
MEAKLRVLMDDRIEKLVLPAGIPPTVEELTNVVKETYAVIDEFSLQYLDSDFEDYFTLNQTDQIKHKDTVKVVYAEQITLNLLPIDGSSFLQSSTEYDSASNAESSAGTSSSHDTIILSNQSTAERREPWPKQFPVPQFAFETGMYLERANEDYKKDGKLLTTSKIQDEFHRITMVHLESKFMSKLDEYTPGLLKLFHSKGGTMGLKLKALLLQTPSNPNINITRDVVIRCLMVYLGERTDQLLKEYDDADEDSASQDLAVQGMAIYSIKTNASEGRGVFACAPIEKGSFVVEYRGELISQYERDKRQEKYTENQKTFFFDFEWNNDIW